MTQLAPSTPVAVDHTAEIARLKGELEKAWDQYQKVKALALKAGTEHEGRIALRHALIAAIKLAI